MSRHPCYGNRIPLSGNVILRLLVPEGQSRLLACFAQLNGRQDEERKVDQHDHGHRSVQV